MFQIRIHGRGGQGVVSAAELLSVAAFLEGHHAQAFPSFGSERMGAPVVSFCRLDDKEIRMREPIGSPDAVIIQDPTLLQSVDVFAGLRRDGYILLNSTRSLDDLGIAGYAAGFPPGHVVNIAATEIAVHHIKRPVPNAPLLGSFAAVSGRMRRESVEQAVLRKFPGPVGKANVEAVREAYARVRSLLSGEE